MPATWQPIVLPALASGNRRRGQLVLGDTGATWVARQRHGPVVSVEIADVREARVYPVPRVGMALDLKGRLGGSHFVVFSRWTPWRMASDERDLLSWLAHCDFHPYTWPSWPGVTRYARAKADIDWLP